MLVHEVTIFNESSEWRILQTHQIDMNIELSNHYSKNTNMNRKLST